MVLTPKAQRRQGAGMVALVLQLQARAPQALRGLLTALRELDGSSGAARYDQEVKSPNRSTTSSTERMAFERMPHERRRERLGEISAQVISLLNEALTICDHYVPPVDVAKLTCTGYRRKCVRIVPPERRAGGLCDACRMAKSRAEGHVPDVPAK